MQDAIHSLRIHNPVPDLVAMPGSSNLPIFVPRGTKILVSIATYNEADNLPALVESIRGQLPDADILIIDDNSPDGTGQLAEELRKSHPQIQVMHRAGKLGLGTAILAGMNQAMEQDYDLLINLDADFSHPPRYLPALIRGMRDRDVMIGSRYIAGGGVQNWPWSRQLISLCVNVFVRNFLRMPVRDASGAYRCYRVAMLRKSQLEKVRSRGYSFQQEVLFRCFLAGSRIGEFPIVFENRKAGASKVSWKESVRSLSMLGWLGAKVSWNRFRGRAAA